MLCNGPTPLKTEKNTDNNPCMILIISVVKSKVTPTALPINIKIIYKTCRKPEIKYAT